MASLQEQLLKAGLTSKHKARQANTDKRKRNKQKRSGVEHEDTLQEQVKQELGKTQAEKAAKDAALNAQKNQQMAEKEQALRILQILQHHQLKRVSGEHEYNFTFNGKVKKVAVDKVTHNALINGHLALCGVDETSYIVTAQTAEKLATLDKNLILVLNESKPSEDVAEDDPYADYQIPDDLMW